MSDIYVFWDNSNIFISAQNVADIRERAKYSVRLEFSNLIDLATCKRPVKKAIAVGSVPPGHQELWNKMKQKTGLALELYERGRDSGKEQGVDQCLQTQMLRALNDEPSPKIIVLLTGDGAGAADGKGFLADLQRFHSKGWGIEVLSWENSCNSNLKTWTEENGVFVSLDKFYESITFIQGGRAATALSLKTRKVSSIREVIDPEKEALLRELKAYKEKERRKKAYGNKVAKRKAKKH